MKPFRAAVGLSILVLCSLRSEGAGGADAGAFGAELKVAKDFETAIQRQDSAAAGKIIDAETIVARAQKGVQASPAYAAEFRKGNAESLREAMIQTTTSRIKVGGSYKLLHVRKQENRIIAVFRLLDGPAGNASYFEWEIGADATGKLRFTDQFELAKGDWTSRLLVPYYVVAVATEDKQANSTLPSELKDLALGYEGFVKLSDDVQAGHFETAMEDFKALPVGMQKSKACLILRVAAAANLKPNGKDAYTAAMADFERNHPNDPTMEILGLGQWVMDKNFARAHKAVDRISEFVGSDAYLDSVRGSTYLATGEPADRVKAMQSYRAGIAREPELAANHLGLLTVYVAEKDYRQAAAELTVIETKLGLPIGDLTKVPEYSDFVKSDAYKKWAASRSTKTAPARTH